MDYGPFFKSQHTRTELTLKPYTVQVWSRYPPESGGGENPRSPPSGWHNNTFLEMKISRTRLKNLTSRHRRTRDSYFCPSRSGTAIVSFGAGVPVQHKRPSTSKGMLRRAQLYSARARTMLEGALTSPASCSFTTASVCFDPGRHYIELVFGNANTTQQGTLIIRKRKCSNCHC